MIYKIVPKSPIASIVDAESPESALEGFAYQMDYDMNAYFNAVPATESEIAEFGYVE